uniref:Uncharacterized protein n=1 Tax=Anguilla anguilla TaxID=7936 RepID=A0A0E9T3X6_ANGAN
MIVEIEEQQSHLFWKAMHTAVLKKQTHSEVDVHFRMGWGWGGC